MAPRIDRLAENFVVGEGPHWDEQTQSLYFVDVMGRSIYRYVPATKRLFKAATGSQVSFIIPVKGQKNTFVIGKERDVNIISWDGESDNITVVKTINTGSDININDAKCDVKGRLWTGTISFKDGGRVIEEVGFLYAIERDQVTTILDKITLSNGLAFNTELKKFYYIDSHKKTIDEFDFDAEQGTVENRRPVFNLEKHDIPGIPFGMTIDRNGNLWVAIFGGYRVIKIDPRKPDKLLYTFSLPAKQVTSVAFGGKKLNELYVTTACIELPGAEKLYPPENGAFYRIIRLGVTGVPAENFII